MSNRKTKDKAAGILKENPGILKGIKKKYQGYKKKNEPWSAKAFLNKAAKTVVKQGLSRGSQRKAKKGGNPEIAAKMGHLDSRIATGYNTGGKISKYYSSGGNVITGRD